VTTIYLASGNAKKLAELQAMFAKGQGDYTFAAPPEVLEVEETGTTFAANARLKAEAGAKAFGAPCLADDSGLCVDALDGRPGVYSARYAATDEARIAKLLGELQGVPRERRTARFVCAIALVWPDGRAIEVEGRCEGEIAEAPRGAGGFGYDPVFLIPALGRTFAELEAVEKNAMSHRALAVSRLRQALR
jgi:XTP/dITP diphosphohydrolase